MPGNPSPIFARVGKIGQANCIAAVTSSNLTSGSLIFTADSTNGSIVKEVRVKYFPGTTTAATAFRVYYNNGSNQGNWDNNSLISEITLAIVTTSQTAATTDYVVPMPGGGLVMPPGSRLYATIGTYSTGAFHVMAIGGDY